MFLLLRSYFPTYISLDEVKESMNDNIFQFPNAELMTSLQPPTQDEMESPNQLLQINAVDPIMEERPSFQNKYIHPQILSHFKANEVHTFSYSRPYHKVKDKENEFASLWIERTVLFTK